MSSVVSKILSLPRKLIHWLTAPLPPGLWLANVFFQRILRINASTPWMVNYTSRVVGNVSIGNNVWKSFAISGGCYVQGGNGIQIGDDTIFAPNVVIVSANHSMDDITKSESAPPIKIGARCWIGANAVILPSVELGDDVVVGAGSVVTKSFPSRSVIAGVPASLLRAR